MPFQIIRNDITKVKADAIVNTANPKPVIGDGCDRAVYEAAGKDELLAARKKIGNIAIGSAVYTDAFHLNAKYIIHTVGPAWIDGKHKEQDILHSCYRKSLNLANKLGCKSIAFPLIATGVYGFPKDEALQIALFEFNRFLLKYDMNILLVVFDNSAFELSGKLVNDIDEFIDEHSANRIMQDEYAGNHSGNSPMNIRRRRELAEMAPFETADESPQNSVMPDAAGKNLAEFVGHKGKTFQEKLFELIDESGMDDVTVYKKANIDRKLFSKIKSNVNYKPTKKTAVSFAIALKLDMPTMTDLLRRAEISFSDSSTFDLIITYFVTQHNYNIMEIDAALFRYEQPTLGSDFME